MNRVRTVIECDDRVMRQYTGKGICVAVLDSGIQRHPDLYGKVVAFRDFVGGKRTAKAPYDDNGHGTHV